MNPFQRLRESQNWSQSECAKHIGINVRAIARLECGLYTNPLPSAVDYWTTNRGLITIPELLTEYEDFVFNSRQSNHRLFGTLHVNLSSGVHPWRNIRARLNPDPAATLSGCAKAMCIPLDTLQFWEKKWRTQKSVPKVLLLALNQMGYTQVELDKFKEIYKSWREIHLDDAKPKPIVSKRQISSITNRGGVIS
jgi:DNA-binding XRE family transcriptional regulator